MKILFYKVVRGLLPSLCGAILLLGSVGCSKHKDDPGYIYPLPVSDPDIYVSVRDLSGVDLLKQESFVREFSVYSVLRKRDGELKTKEVDGVTYLVLRADAPDSRQLHTGYIDERSGRSRAWGTSELQLRHQQQVIRLLCYVQFLGIRNMLGGSGNALVSVTVGGVIINHEKGRSLPLIVPLVYDGKNLSLGIEAGGYEERPK